MNTNEKISFFGLSDMGRQRTNNEDAFVAEQLDNNTVLAVAIDGVGGYEGGEVAASIAQTEIPRYLHEFKNGDRIELLKQAVVNANNAIYNRRQEDAERPNMSCVLTSALVDTQRKVIDMVHVGDTRMYQYRHGDLVKLSHDHSLIGYREEVGDLTEEQAMHHPQRNIISRDVGSALHETDDRDFIEAAEFPLLPNSIFLLCSDGLTDLITSHQIKAILSGKGSLQKKAQALIDAANAAGGKDNITVVLVEYTAPEAFSGQASAVSPQYSAVSDPFVREEPKQPRKKQKSLLWTWITVGGTIFFAALIGVYYYSTFMHSHKEKPARIEKKTKMGQYPEQNREEFRELEIAPQDSGCIVVYYPVTHEDSVKLQQIDSLKAEQQKLRADLEHYRDSIKNLDSLLTVQLQNLENQ